MGAKIKILTPPGFIRYKKDGSKGYYFRCAKVDSNGETCKFEYRNDRKPKNGTNHTCTFKERLKEPDIIEKNVVQRKILRLIVYLLAKSNSSISFGTKKDTHIILANFMQLGREIDPDTDITELFNKATYRSVRRMYLTEANNSFQNHYIEFVPFKLVSLAIDGGTIHNKYHFDVYICNPLERIPPLMVYSTKDHMKSTETISKDILDAINSVRELAIVGIVGDNYKAQVKAVKEIITMQLQKSNYIIWCPCSCHVINLILQDSYKKSRYFRNNIDQLRRIGKRYNAMPRSPNVIRKTCPMHIPTRWVIDLDIAVFLLSVKSELINLFQNDKDSEIVEWSKSSLIEIALILVPLRSAIQILESDTSIMGDIYPILIEIEDFYIDHVDCCVNAEEVREVMKIIVDNISERMKNTMDRHMLLLSYSLTAPGRLFIRSKMLESTYRLDSFTSDDQETSILSFEKKYVRLILESCKSPWFVKKKINEIEEEDEIEEEEVEELDCEEELEELFEEEEIPNDSGYLWNCINSLKIISQNMGLDVDRIVYQYEKWITEAISTTDQLYMIYISTTDRGLFWRTLQNDPEWFELATVARTVHSITAAEVCCERGFSKRRYTTPKDRMSTKDDLATARFHLVSQDLPKNLPIIW